MTYDNRTSTARGILLAPESAGKCPQFQSPHFANSSHSSTHENWSAQIVDVQWFAIACDTLEAAISKRVENLLRASHRML
jgi:hypothetical protein